MANVGIDEQMKALADPVRMRIVRLLALPARSRSAIERGFCACDIESVMGVGQSTISHHMKFLVNANLVVAEKSGRWVYYRINQAAFAALASALANFAGDEAGCVLEPQPDEGIEDMPAEGACLAPAAAPSAKSKPGPTRKLVVVGRKKQA